MNNTETGCRTGAVVDVSNLDATYVNAKVGILNRHANAKDAKKETRWLLLLSDQVCPPPVAEMKVYRYANDKQRK